MKAIGRKTLSLLLTLLLVLGMLPGLAVSARASAAELGVYTETAALSALVGAPESGGAYGISTAAELKKLAALVNAGNDCTGAVFFLKADIDLAGSETDAWTPIGQYDPNTEKTDPQNSFNGLFDGCGHEVKGLYVGGGDYTGGSGARNENNGLFGLLGESAAVRDLALSGEVHTYRTGAGIAGVNRGLIERCFVKVNVSANGGGGLRGSGGIAGTNYGSIKNCVSAGSVHNDYRRAGGIVGYNYGSGAVIERCVNLGTVSSASAGYAGGIAASNGESAETAGSIRGCASVSGGCEALVGLDHAASEIKTFNENAFLLDGTGAATDVALLSYLNGGVEPTCFIAPAAGAFPVLFWQPGYSWLTYAITVNSPEGGSFSAELNGTPLTGTASLSTGTVVTLKASAPEEGYFFGGFTVTALNNHDNLLVSGIGKGAYENGTYTLQYAVSQNATLSAAYVAYTSTALTVYTQTGDGGMLTPVKTYSWNDLLTTYKESAPQGYGYQYTHGADGWTVIGVTEYADVIRLLEASGVSIADGDVIVPRAGDSQPSVLATWAQLKEARYFYPDTVTVTATPLSGETQVPAALALSWASSANAAGLPADASTGDKLHAAAEIAVNSGNLRFVWGSSRSDYEGTVNEGGSITGNRLWNNVDGIIIRNHEAVFDFAGEPLTLAQLKAYEQTKTFTSVKSGVTSTYTVKGITVSDLLAHYYRGGSAASVTFAAADGFSATAENGSYAWDDVMLIWSMVDESGAEKQNAGLRCALNGSAPKAWVSGVVTAAVVDQAVKINGVAFSTAQLKAHSTTKNLNLGATPTTVTGITAADLETYFLGADVQAACFTFAAADGFSAGVSNSDYAWDDVMLIWDGAGASESKLRSAVNGGYGNLWVSNVAEVNATPAAICYDGTRLSLAQLRGLADTKTLSKNGTDTEVTGVTLAKLRDNFGGGASAVLTASAKDGYSASVANYLYGWDEVMVIWSGDGASEQSLKLAVNGARGKLWVGGLYTLELTPAELTIGGVGFTKAQLTGSAETATLSTVKNGSNSDYTVTGVSFETLSSVYGVSADTVAYTFTASDGFSRTVQVGPDGDYTAADAWVIWSQLDADGTEKINSAFKSAFNGSSPGMWVGGLSNISVGYTLTVNAPEGAAVTVKNAAGEALTAVGSTYAVQSGESYSWEVSKEHYVTKTGSAYVDGPAEVNVSLEKQAYKITFAVTPEAAVVTVKDSAGAAVGGNGKYMLYSGETYTYTAAADGYETKSGSITVSAKETVTVTLTAKGGGGDPEPEPTVLTLYVKENGSTTKVAELTKKNLYELVDNTGVFVYQFYKSDRWEGVVATKVASYDNLFGSAGFRFSSGDSIQPAADDGFYDTRSYENIAAQSYSFNVDTGAQSVVPAGIAVEWDGGSLSGGGAVALAGSAYYGKLRSVLGITRQMYEESPINAAADKEVTARGMRLVNGVSSITLIKGQTVNNNPKQNADNRSEDGDSTESESAIITPKTTVVDGKLEATVSSVSMSNAIKAAKSSSSKVRIVIDAAENVNTVGLSLHTDDILTLAKEAGTPVSIETLVGKVELSAEALEAIGSQSSSAGVHISIAKLGAAEIEALLKNNGSISAADIGGADAFKVEITSGNSKITSFGGNTVKLCLPVGEGYVDGESYRVLAVSDDGSTDVLTARVSADGDRKTAELGSTRLTVFIITYTPAISFTDVKLGAWYYDAVVYAVTKKLFNGVGENEFAPEGHMTRAMLASVLYRMAGSPALPADQTVSFADVKSGTWYSDAIAWAKKAGVTDGYADGRFGVNDEVTREQLAVMLFRFASALGASAAEEAALDAYTDNSEISPWALEAMRWCGARGFITGRSETTLVPRDTVTRAEAAAILMRYQNT